jgi:hypothetical protein
MLQLTLFMAHKVLHKVAHKEDPMGAHMEGPMEAHKEDPMGAHTVGPMGAHMVGPMGAHTVLLVVHTVAHMGDLMVVQLYQEMKRKRKKMTVSVLIFSGVIL